MKNRLPRTIATKLGQALLGAVLLLAGATAWAAQVVGVIAHLNGPLLDRKADGTVKVLAEKSEVESGDTLVTEKNTYGMVRLVDNSEITLKPNTTFKIDDFAYDAGKPEGDRAAFTLVKGGLRSITGLLGKRNKEKFELKTPNATIGIRGTTFIVQYVDAGGLPGGPGELALGKTAGGPAPNLVPGLHLTVLDGAIVVTNTGGSQGFQAGQFGFVPSVTQPPIIVPPHADLRFVPPPSFGSNGPAPGPVSSTGEGNVSVAANKDGAVDCVVR